MGDGRAKGRAARPASDRSVRQLRRDKSASGGELIARPGEILGVIGPNGAGKTTLIDAVSGFVPCKGKLELAGQPIESVSVTERSKRGVTRSFQQLELLEDVSVYENFSIAGRVKHRGIRGRGKYDALSPGTVAAIKEFGLEPDLEKLVRDLPYGKRRFVAIARALANSPSIILLDEPAAGLDSNERSELSALIEKLATEWGIGFVVVEHNMDFVMHLCSNIIVLEFGMKSPKVPL